MGDVEEKDMGGEGVAAPPGEEGVGVKQEIERVGEEDGEVLVKSVPNDELNSKIAHDVDVPGDVDESIVAVAGSVDESVEPPVSAGDAVTASGDREVAPAGNVVDAAEKVESWDLSEAVTKNEKEDLKPKISEDGSPAGVDSEDAPVVSIDAIEDSVGGEPVFVSSHDEEEAEGSGHAGGVTEVPSEIGGGEDVSPEIPAEGSAEKVVSEAVDAPVEEVHEVVEATNSVEPDEESGTLEAVPSPSDGVEEKSVEVNSGDVSEVASILPSESVDNEGESSEIAAEGPSDNVDSEALEVPVDSEKLDDQVVHEVVEPTTGAQAEEGSAEPESVSAPADDVDEKSVEVNSEDISEATTAEANKGSEEPEPLSVLAGDVEEKSAEVNSEDTSEAAIAEAGEGLAEPEPVSAPVAVEKKSVEVNAEDTSEAAIAEADEGSAEPESVSAPAGDVEEKSVEVNAEDTSEAAIAEADKGSAEPESVSAPAGDVEEKSVEVNAEDTSEAVTVLPSESAENEDVSPKLSAEGPSDNVDSEALDTPLESEGLVPEADDKVVEPTTSAEAVEGSAEPESVSAPIDVEEKSVEVNSEDIGAAAIAEAGEGSLEPESVSAPVDVEEKSVEGNSEDTSEANNVMPSESPENDVNHEIPAAGPSDIVDSKSLEAPVDSEGLEPEVVHEVVEATISAEADEGSVKPEPVSTPAGDTEERSVEVNSEDTSDANTGMASEESADNQVASRELEPAEGSVDNVGSEETLYAPVEEVHEVVESTNHPEPHEQSAEPESMSVPPDDVEDESVEVNSGDVSEATTALESADNEAAGSGLHAEESADNVSSVALEPETVHEVVEPTTSTEPKEESAEPEPVTAPDHVEDKFIEVNSEDTSGAVTVLPSESADNEVVSSELPAENFDQIGEAADASTEAKPDEESTELVSVSAPPDDIEDKSVVMTEPITESESADKEVVEEPADNVSSDALDAQALHEVMEPTTSDEPVKESAEPESVFASSDSVEEKSIDLNSEDVTKVTTASESADNEDLSPEPSIEEPSGNVGSEVSLYAPAEEVHEVVEATISAEPNEESTVPESVPAPSDDVEDGFVMVNSRDVAEDFTELESADNEIVSPELPAEGSADNFNSEVIEHEEVHEVMERTTSAEADEGSAEPEALSAADDVEDKFVEVNTEDTSDAVAVLPSESAENEVVSRDLPAETSANKVDAPVEEIGEIEDAAANANPDEVSASLESVAAPSDDAQSTPKEVGPEVSAPEMEDESIIATSTPLPTEEEKSDLLEHEHEQSEVSHEGSVENGVASIGVDTATESKETNTAEHTAEELLDGAASGDAPEGLLSEEPSDLSLNSHEEPLSSEDGVALVDRCIQVEELPQERAAESQRDVSTDAEVNAGDEGFAEGGDIIKEESPETQSPSANRDLSVEDVSHMLQTEMADEEAAHVAIQPVEDVSHLLQTVMTDEEVKLAADHHPENNVAPEESVEDETPALESENSHEESLIPPAESSGASQANEGETVSREFNFNNFSEAPTTSEEEREAGDESHDAVTSEQVIPYLATALAIASGEEGNSSDAAANDTTELEISSPSPVVEKEVAPRSYNLDEVATNLHDAAEKALEDAKSSNIGDGQTSVAQSVAQIVLDESSKTGDPSEYISGVVQDVAQLAQNAASSDPNILPDTVTRVFDGETAGSPANEASQSKETTSLGTMFSLFIVWCVSLCASRISSKNMPAPALKLAAEEVTAVLHSNAPSQPAPPHEAASSNH